MAGPSLVASYPVYSAGADTSTLTTSAFTPSNGEVLVVKLTTWDTAAGMSAPTGGTQTYTAVNTAAPGGFNGWAAVYVATVSGSPGSMTVSSACATTTSTRHSMVVERWSGAQVDATPATNATKSGSGSTTATTTLTSTAADSVVSWCMVDLASRDPAAGAYVTTSGTVTQDGLYDGHAGANSVQYFAYQTAATAGSQTFGVTNASNLTWVAVGVEVKSSATAWTGSATSTATASTTAAAGLSAVGSATDTTTAATTATAALTASASATSTTTATITAEATTGAVTTVQTGSWYGLLDILAEAADIARQYATTPPAACPNDGEPLITGPDGRLFCRFDGWRPDL